MEVEFIHVSKHSTAITMLNGPVFLESFAGSWQFKENTDGSTKATFTYLIKSKSWAIPIIADFISRKYFFNPGQI